MIVMALGDAAWGDGDDLPVVTVALAAVYHAGQPVVAVVGAMPGAMDFVREGITHGSYTRIHNKLRSIHINLARKLIRDERDRALLIQDIEDMLGTYDWLGRTLTHRQPTPAETASMLTIGDRLGARLVSAALQSQGVSVSALNGHEVVRTAGPDLLGAPVDPAGTQAQCRDRVQPLLEQRFLLVVGGGSGLTPDGQVSWLGGDGVYVAASALAVGGQAMGLWLMHDMTDVHLVNADGAAKTLSAQSLSALADYGHTLPRAELMAPVLAAQIPVAVCDAASPLVVAAAINERVQTGVLVIQREMGGLFTEGSDRQAALALLDAEGIRAVSDPDGHVYYMPGHQLDFAQLVLRRAQVAQGIHTELAPVSLVTLVGVSDAIYERVELGWLALSAGQLHHTMGQRGGAGLSIVLPADLIDSHWPQLVQVVQSALRPDG